MLCHGRQTCCPERDALRQEYLADIRASMIDQLEHTTVIEPDGTRRKLQVRH